MLFYSHGRWMEPDRTEIFKRWKHWCKCPHLAPWKRGKSWSHSYIFDTCLTHWHSFHRDPVHRVHSEMYLLPSSLSLWNAHIIMNDFEDSGTWDVIYICETVYEYVVGFPSPSRRQWSS
jgi:hypothetical protein